MTSQPTGWRGFSRVALIVGVAVAALATVIPIVLIMPFLPQPQWAVTVAFHVARFAPWITGIGVLVALGGAIGLWPGATRWARFGIAGATAVAAWGFWMARQNRFEWMFAPLENPAFAPAHEGDWVTRDDMVLAVEVHGDAVAFPVRQLAYHHLVQDVVGGVPIVATY